ncbi:MAG: phosphoribosyltransferase domain-containing protein [Patescibacteria group bacterium]|nr:phosphoribosyltransferase domain-containing protein [Patescibacteria group bacterium]
MTIDVRDKNQLDILERDMQTRLRRDYPALYWDRFVLVDTSNTRLAIDDISYRAQISLQEDIETSQVACRGWLEVYDAQDLTFALDRKLETLLRTVNKKKTVLIFPGAGAQVVKELLPQELTDGLNTVEIPTQRVVNPKTGSIEEVELGEKNRVRRALSDTKAETVIVLDDVIVTGATLKTIQQTFPMKHLEWFACALMTLSPLRRRNKSKNQCGVEGYKAVTSPVIYQGITGIPPLNSLSMLIGNSNKSRSVRDKYLENYVDDKETFLEAIQMMRGKVKL